MHGCEEKAEAEDAGAGGRWHRLCEQEESHRGHGHDRRLQLLNGSRRSAEARADSYHERK